MPGATHREVKKPQISARDLADYMAAGTRERAKRRIIRDCKYRAIGRIIQHDEAKITISNFFLLENQDVGQLLDKAEWVRGKLADSDFEADLNAHNADYIKRFANVFGEIDLPDATLEPPGKTAPLTLSGVKVTIDMCFRTKRKTRTNKIKIGAAMLRYAKGKALDPASGEWQSAYLFGYLDCIKPEDQAEPEHKLCLTIDAYSGCLHQAPTNSMPSSRFHEMEAACATIAERWPNIEPPDGAVF